MVFLYVFFVLAAAVAAFWLPDLGFLPVSPELAASVWLKGVFSLSVLVLARITALLLASCSRRKVAFVAGGLLIGLLFVWLVGSSFAIENSLVLFSVACFLLPMSSFYSMQLERKTSFLPWAAGGFEALWQKGTGTPYRLLDTSVIIDGRIADVVETGFIDGVLIVPQFVLDELQGIADSHDGIKRSRGRRGLDILNRIRKCKHCEIKISETDFDDIPEVDSKLLALAQKMQAAVLTNDFNLNKIASLKDINVLNINELANALKPNVLPGEKMTVKVIREGKDPDQGIAYLEDGTMIVIEQGKRYINQQIGVVVTSVFQTPAGRMIFTESPQNQTA